MLRHLHRHHKHVLIASPSLGLPHLHGHLQLSKTVELGRVFIFLRRCDLLPNRFYLLLQTFIFAQELLVVDALDAVFFVLELQLNFQVFHFVE